MRVSLFVSALFAVSLFGGAAMADRTGEDGGRTSRMPRVSEMKMNHVREARDVRTQDKVQVKVAKDNHVTDRFRTKGDMVDRTPKAASSKASHGGAYDAKSQRDMEKAMRRLNEKQRAQQNCSPTDETCASFGRTTGPAKAQQAAKNETQAKMNAQKAELKKMVDKVREQRMKRIILAKICAVNANACAGGLVSQYNATPDAF
jgi:hypothetical protein